jgi:hypothetical protein
MAGVAHAAKQQSPGGQPTRYSILNCQAESLTYTKLWIVIVSLLQPE